MQFMYIKSKYFAFIMGHTLAVIIISSHILLGDSSLNRFYDICSD